jgi:hypothetical protein
MKNRIAGLIARFRGLSLVRRLLVVVVVSIAGLFILGQFNRPSHSLHSGSSAVPEIENALNELQPDTGLIDSKEQAGAEVDKDEERDPRKYKQFAAQTRIDNAGSAGISLSGMNPMIAHTASLTVATKEFAKSRSSLEEILERHRGYAARLRMAGRRTGSVLSATLRVPSSELGPTVSDLKSLGDVEQEEQSADEITQQHADLEARLANARATLRRLQELLTKQTYPDGNVRELQRQIANASAEVNRLESERTSSEHRVIFANLQFSMREEIAQPAETLGSQLHSAAVAGFGQAAASISGLLVFLIGRGPVVLLWMAILFFPARFAWKRLQPTVAQSHSPVPAA